MLLRKVGDNNIKKNILYIFVIKRYINMLYLLFCKIICMLTLLTNPSIEEILDISGLNYVSEVKC